LSIAGRRDLAAVARPSVSTGAHAAVRAVKVQSSMPVAMKLTAASWWNGTVDPTETIHTATHTSICCIEVVCYTMPRTILRGIAGRRDLAAFASESIGTVAHTAICAVFVQGGMPIAVILAAASWRN